ncbi:MAG: hypothetical protein EXS05_03790 [Planctomycetaceae bacterium]|nr:hypothetical protein [Planctomycetaceae bacterium]
MPQARCDTESIFWEAMAIESPAERARFMERACGDDPRLRTDIERLLRAYPQAEKFLESPAPAMQPTLILAELPERLGTQIGPYKLREVLGEGGMGIVYVAEQEQPVRRKVALKVIKPGMDTREVIARFEAERQALALMDHPNIAKILDAGTTEEGARDEGRGATG